MARIALCTPHRPFVLDRWSESCNRLTLALRDDGHTVTRFKHEGNALLDQARSMVATQALDEGYDVQVWTDDDGEFWEDAKLLVEGALKTKSLVAAPMAIRGGSRLNVQFADPIAVGFFRWGGLREIYSAGCGLTAIHRDVFVAVEKSLGERLVVMDHIPPCVPFFDKLITRVNDDDKFRRWMGEDQSFCVRARMVGCKLWCDTRVRSKHYTPRGYSVEDVIEGLPQDQEEMEATFG